MGLILRFHPAAGIFPLMEDDEYQALVDDIREHGQREPILMHPDGRILDGRNRYCVCRDLGLEPKFREWDDNGDSPTSVVISLNLHRRHLNSSQKAAIAVEILPMLEREAKERQRMGGTQKVPQKIGEPNHESEATEQAAKQFGTNREYVSAAKKIKKADPALLLKVRDGKIRIPAALRRVVKDQRKEQDTGAATPKPEEPEEQQAQDVEQGRGEGTFFDAIKSLNSMPVEPEQFASEIPEYCRFWVENDLDGALDYLKRFKEAWLQGVDAEAGIRQLAEVCGEERP